ncbi:MAG: 50S ribosomal protein L3 [Candidatus Marsarchaeota archaeon]|nr:50S ribosomal protein L3 [Candidatus Marsarchaeota archaeon]
MARGSLQYWQKRRAYRRLPRVRNYPDGSKEPVLTGLIGYKAGMTHAAVNIDGRQEEIRACTIIEVPRTEAYGIRLYKKDPGTNYKRIFKEIYDKGAAQRAGIKKPQDAATSIAKDALDAATDVSALMVAYPRGTATGQHHPDRFEVRVSGGSAAEKFDYATKQLGKEVRPYDIFKNGEHIDVTSVSTGKGWAGVIKRFGVARLDHKATQKTRHVGVLGSFGIARVLYSVPQSGQMGFNYRTEHNKRILKVGGKEESAAINTKALLQNYGNIHNDFFIIDGSIPGPAKRLVRIRKSLSNRDSRGIKESKITYLATTDKGI